MATSKFWLVLTVIVGAITTFLIINYLSGVNKATPNEPMTKIVVMFVDVDLAQEEAILTEKLVSDKTGNELPIITLAENMGKLKLVLRPAAGEVDSPLGGLDAKGLQSKNP